MEAVRESIDKIEKIVTIYYYYSVIIFAMSKKLDLKTIAILGTSLLSAEGCAALTSDAVGAIKENRSAFSKCVESEKRELIVDCWGKYDGDNGGYIPESCERVNERNFNIILDICSLRNRS